MSTDVETRLNEALRERVAAMHVDVPSVDRIAGRAAAQRRRTRVGGAAALVIVLVAAAAMLAARPGAARRVIAADGPHSAARPQPAGSTESALPAVPQIALDRWTTTYFISTGDGPYVEYQFTSPAGGHLQVSFYKPAELRGDRGAAPAIVRGTNGTVLDYGGGRFRADWVERGRLWEADGAPFADRGAFLATVATVHDVDAEAWYASLPAGTVLPEQRSAAVDHVLSGIPVPDGFDVEALRHGAVPASRYDLAFDVVGHVMCAWVAQWGGSPSTPAGAAARSALSGAHDWPILNELSGAGGMSDVFWLTADRVVAGDRAVLDSYRQALGCA
jgi:hypothetical protein